MLNTQQIELLKALYSTLDERQKIWLAGYVQGQVGEIFAPPATGGEQGTAKQAAAKTRVAIYYATETGNSKALALNLMKALKGAGFKASNTAMNRLKPADIKPDQPAIFLASTHGEGDPPEAAIKFFDALAAEKDGALDGLNYAVLGLGDSSYEIFCGAATQLDEQLQRLGGKPFQDIALFDVDYASHTPGWIKTTADALNKTYGEEPATTGGPVDAVNDFFANMGAAEETVRTGRGYTRLEPVTGTVKEIINLNDAGSDKQTYHLEIAYEDDIIYTPGDSAGIILPPGPDGKELTPRLYSIASSPSLHERELHLTVALATHVEEDGSIGHGVCSHHLSQLKAGDEVQFFISQNQLFNLPQDDAQDIIMIGPGTGIAPFRSFVHERSERGADGRNWLFYGDRHAHCDFLYQAEWQEHLATETLHRIDAAFSRDQDEKIYVQDKLRAHAEDLLQWVDNGAAIYVCGAKDPMSRDVETTLVDIIAQDRGITPDQAADVLADWEESGRYLKDVY